MLCVNICLYTKLLSLPSVLMSTDRVKKTGLFLSFPLESLFSLNHFVCMNGFYESKTPTLKETPFIPLV